MPGAIVGALVADAVGTAIGGEVLFGTLTTGKLIGTAVGFVASSIVSSAVAEQADNPQASADPVVQSQGRLVTVRQPVAPWQVVYGKARVGGVMTFAHVSSDQQYLHLIITLAGHESHAVDAVYFDDWALAYDGNGDATDRYAGYVRVKVSLGDEGTTQPFPDLVAESEGKWTADHRQQGRTKIYVRLKASPDLFPTGVPNITVVLRGKKVYDPRSLTTAYSANAALCVDDYLTCTAYAFGATYASEIDETALIAAANACDEDVTLASGGTEDRYTVGGAFLTSAAPNRTLGLLLAAMAGKAVNIGGKWFVYAGAYDTPTVTLDESDLAGPIRVQSLISRRENANGVKGIFTDPNSSWQPTDFPAIASSTYLAEDGNERVWRDLDLSAFVTSGTQAQRLAKIDLLSVRQGLTVVMPCKLTAWKAQTGRTVAVTNTKFGWSSKAFDVQSSRFIVGDDGTLGVELSLRETASAVYDWATSEEQAVDLAPNSNLPDPWTVAAPGAPSVTEALYSTTGSAGVKARATVTWGASADAFVTQGGYYELLVNGTLVGPISGTTYALDDMAPGVHTFAVRAINAIGVASDYSATVSAELYGLTAPPSNVANFAVTPYSGQARFTWSKASAATDLDVLIGGRVYVRWSPKTTGASWDYGSLVNPDGYPGDTSIGFGPLMTGTYMAKFCDSSGNYSATEATFVATEALITGLSTIASVTESPTFAGAKSNVAAVDGGIQLDGTTLIDSMATLMDSWGSIDSLGGVQATGTYTFANTLDLGSKTAARLFTTLDSIAFDTDDLIDSRTNNVDDWGLIDGAVVDDCEAQLMVRTSDDNITYSAYQALGLVGDFNFRYFQFRLDFASGNVTHNRSVTSLAVTAKH